MRAISAMAMVLAVTSAACGESEESVSPAEPGVNIYVGSVTAADGASSNVPDVSVGLVMNGDATEIFFCGGPDEVDSRTAWLEGTVDASRALATSAAVSLDSPGWVVRGDVSDASGSGTAELIDENGELTTMNWEIDRIDPSQSPAGLYDASAPGCRVSVVVHEEDDAELWMRGAYCDPRGFFDQVTPVMPIQLTAELALRVLVGEAQEEILVERVVPGLDTADSD